MQGENCQQVVLSQAVTLSPHQKILSKINFYYHINSSEERKYNNQKKNNNNPEL